MKLQVAVVYGGRSGEHEISRALRRSRFMTALDPRASTRSASIFITKEGKWEPRPILPEPGAQSRHRRRVPGAARHVRRRRHGPGPARTGRPAVRRRGRAGSSVSMDKEVTKRLLQRARAAGGRVRRRSRGSIDSTRPARASPFPVFVKPANLGSSVGISKANNRAELNAAIDAGGAVRPQDHRRARHHRAASSSAPCWATTNPMRRDALRDPAVARVLRLRRQVSARHSAKTSCRPNLTPKQTAGDPAAGGRLLTGRWTARAWRAWISCWKARRARSTSTRSTPFPASRPSACIPKMWEHGGIAYSELLDRLIELALERAATRKATRYTR